MQNKHIPDIEGIVEEFQKALSKVRAEVFTTKPFHYAVLASETDRVAREFIQSQADKYEREKGEMVKDFMEMFDIKKLIEKPHDEKHKGHGSCCYCDTCHHDNDYCVCEHNRTVRDIKTIAQKYDVDIS